VSTVYIMVTKTMQFIQDFFFSEGA